MRKLRLAFAIALAGCASHGGVARTAAPALSRMAVEGAAFPAPDSAAVVHLLNRLAFGPRPADVERVQRMGVGPWLQAQLNPGSIADTAVAAMLAPHADAFLPPTELFRRYPPPAAQLRQAQARRQNGMDGRPAQPDTMEVRRIQMGYRMLGAHVQMSALVRHIGSDRQLEEVMTDFWTNHFNVFLGKDADRWLTADYIEHAIRPNALGRFEDLLVATAQHPAMLVYLDNAMSVAPGSTPPFRGGGGGLRPGIAIGRGFPGRPGIGGMPGNPGRGGLPGIGMQPGSPQQPQQQRRAPTGINENYARELMELHTLGVDGGYTQQDVINVARILTGWSVVRPAEAARIAEGGRPLEFEFRGWAHDLGEKEVLGVKFPAGHGEDEGLRLLHVLAEHPSTARHLAHKLCARFVEDTPPDGCVDAAVHAYLLTHGDIRAVILAIVRSPDFWAGQNRRAKVKSPLEFVASAVRAIDAEPDTTPRLTGALQQLGQPLFMQQVPTGYPETAEEWVNSGALLNRMNLAVALAAGRLPGAVVDLDRVVPATLGRDALVARVNAVVLGGQGSAHTLEVIRQQIADLSDPRMARTMAVGLALGSPDFQKQ